MRVIVVGAGVGGLATALALHARGLRPQLLERETRLEPAGAGLQLGPNAVRVLDALGVGDELRACASTPQALEIRRGSDGRLLTRTPLGEAQARWRAPYLQLRRSALQALLLKAVRERDAADIGLGAPAASATAAGEIRLADGARLQGDVVVAADGLRSVVAEAVLGDGEPRTTGQTAWRALVPADRLSPGPHVTVLRVGRGAHLVAYPLDGGAVVNLVAVADGGGEESWTAQGDPAELRRRFAGWAQPVPGLLDALEGLPLWRGAIFDRAPRPSWIAGRAALLGDAAHPMSPSFAQGAAMAIEDAWALAQALAERPAAEALPAYEAARRARASRVQRASRRNARLFHLPNALSTPLFRAAQATGGASGGLARFDWLYGGGPIPAGAA